MTETLWRKEQITHNNEVVTILRITKTDVRVTGSSSNGNLILNELINLQHDRKPKNVILNFGKVQEVCSTFIGTLIDSIDKFSLFGGTLLLVETPPIVKEIFVRCNVSSIFSTFSYKNEQEALEDIPKMKGRGL